jgi:protein-S-isoprenylcysteine O-methyltransferase Ste14
MKQLTPKFSALKILELKCPPPIVMLLSAIIAVLISQRKIEFIQQQLTSVDDLIWPLVFFIAGLILAIAGMKEFKTFDTTIHPTHPEKTTSLVTSGIFQFTRNPMYLGLLIVLLGWADLLDSFLAYSGALIFFLYISAFQIKPEEEVMKGKFGEEFSEYCSQVRRWL